MRINLRKTLMIVIIALLNFLLFAETHAGVNTFVMKSTRSRYVTDAIQSSDGNYVLVSRDSLWQNWIIKKITPTGKKVWERTFSVQLTPGGYWHLSSIAGRNDGYVLVGFAADDDISYSAAIVVALHSDGTLNWMQRFFTGGNIGFDAVSSTPDGGFIVTGGSYPYPYHPIIVKFTRDSSIQWYKAFETLSYNFASAFTADKGVILAAQNTGGADVVKVDYLGNIEWKKNLETNPFYVEVVGNTPDGVIIAGNRGSGILALTALKSNGDIDWNAEYALKGPDFSIYDITSTNDGGYAIAGTTRTNSGTWLAGFLLKIDTQKRLVFHRSIRVSGTNETARSVFSRREGGFILFGSSSDDSLFLSLNSKGMVPDCAYLGNLNSRTAQADRVSVSSSNVTSQSLNFGLGSPYDIASNTSSHRFVTICE